MEIYNFNITQLNSHNFPSKSIMGKDYKTRVYYYFKRTSIYLPPEGRTIEMACRIVCKRNVFNSIVLKK